MSAMSTAVSRSASAKTMLGFLPPSSRATFFTVPAAAAITARPVARPPVNDTRSTRGSATSGPPTSGPVPGTRLATPSGTPASARRSMRRSEVDGVSSLGLSTKVQPGGEGRRHLPRGLQQRVVPGRDEGAHPDRLVDDPADHVGPAGVDDPSRVLGRHPAVVAEHRGHVVDVGLALHQPLAGVERLGPGHGVAVAGQEVGHPEQDRTPLLGRGVGPRTRGRRRCGRRRRRPRRRRAHPRPPRRTTAPSAGQVMVRRPPARPARHRPSTKTSGTVPPHRHRRAGPPGSGVTRSGARRDPARPRRSPPPGGRRPAGRPGPCTGPPGRRRRPSPGPC